MSDFPFPSRSGRLPKKSNAASLEHAGFVRARTEDRVRVSDIAPTIPSVVSITGSSSNSGKTWLVESVVRTLAAKGVGTTALKITRTHVGHCPRHNDSCGTCDSLELPFEIIEDRARLDVPKKDTGRYFAAGADQVLWLLVRPEAIAAGLRAVLAHVKSGNVLVAEGNSFRDYADADWTVMALTDAYDVKPSALPIAEKVDLFVARRAEVERAQGLSIIGERRDSVVAADAFADRVEEWWAVFVASRKTRR